MSCLFNSLSEFVINLDENHLRHIICNYLSTNPKIIDDIKTDQITQWENDTNLVDYIQNMRNNTTYGGGLEIKSFCNIFKVKVNVYCDNKIIEFLPNCTEIIKQVNIRYLNRNHYIPMK
jgi:hypothetical protein